MGHERRRSRSSSSSSSSSSSGDDKKRKKDKKDKKNKGADKHGVQLPGFVPVPGQYPQAGHAPQAALAAAAAGSFMPVPGVHGQPTSRGHSPAPPPPYESTSAPPPSGFRIPLTDSAPFPLQAQAGPPATYDADGSPVYVGSAIFERAVHPCKIVPSLRPPPRVAYGGAEQEHYGRYDLLPLHSNDVEWVWTSNGEIPPGRRPVEGGYEENGEKLYHALGTVKGVKVPGKTGTHLRGANVPFGGQEHVVQSYEILCWRQ